jgi:hypothetical protein
MVFGVKQNLVMETYAWVNKWYRKWLKISYSLDIHADSGKFRRCVSNLLKLAEAQRRVNAAITQAHPVTHV